MKPKDVKGKGRETPRLPELGDKVDKGPIEMYLPLLNAVLVALVALSGLLAQQRTLGFLPVGVYAVILAVKVLMGSVDPRELEGLRYGYKGA